MLQKIKRITDQTENFKKNKSILVSSRMGYTVSNVSGKQKGT